MKPASGGGGAGAFTVTAEEEAGASDALAAGGGGPELAVTAAGGGLVSAGFSSGAVVAEVEDGVAPGAGEALSSGFEGDCRELVAHFEEFMVG